MASVKERIKILPKADRAKVIAGVGLLGGVILLIYGLSMTRFYDINDETMLFRYINALVTIVWASLALFGSVKLLKGNEMGYTILFLVGLAGIVGSFIPISSYDHGYGWIELIYLNGTAGYFDLVIILIGGIYGLALTEKEER